MLSVKQICRTCGALGWEQDGFLESNDRCRGCNDGASFRVPSADQSAMILTEKIRKREPFFFVRYGDGALECIAGRDGLTRDMEHYSPLLGRELAECWRLLMSRPGLVYVGDWQAASFDAKTEYSRYREQYEAMFGDAKPYRIHFEALLLMRRSPELLDFYRAVRHDRRKKVFMGPAWNARGAKMLGAEHLEVPTTDLLKHSDDILRQLAKSDFEVLLFGAGMAGNIPAIRCWNENPDRTFVNLGSALDPLFFRRTRNQQLQNPELRYMFRELL